MKDEVGQSAVSGLVVDRELLVPSDRSGQLALKDEMVVCAKSGGRLLPSEIDYSSVSNLRVDQRLLQKSEFSKSLALPEELRTCAVSDRKGVLADGVITKGLLVIHDNALCCATNTEPGSYQIFVADHRISKLLGRNSPHSFPNKVSLFSMTQVILKQCFMRLTSLVERVVSH